MSSTGSIGRRETTGRRVPPGTRVRAMEQADVGRVGAIEAASCTIPRKPATFGTLLGWPGAVLLVLEVPPHRVAGYAVLWCIQDHGELANIAVIPELRDRGLGSYLLDYVMDEACQREVVSLYLEVRISNFRARSMYGSHGFEEIGVCRDYYERPQKDARVLIKRLTPLR